jgi:hypothetical protein
VIAQASAAGVDQCAEFAHVQGHAFTAVQDMQYWGASLSLYRVLAGSFLGAPLAVKHIGARDVVLLCAHQTQLNLVLHVLDREGAAAGA